MSFTPILCDEKINKEFNEHITATFMNLCKNMFKPKEIIKKDLLKQNINSSK